MLEGHYWLSRALYLPLERYQNLNSPLSSHVPADV